MARAAGRVGVMGPVSRGGRRRQAPGRLDPELEEAAKKWADQTSDAQGMPRHVMDETVISEVAVLLASGRVPVSSGPPQRFDPVRIEPVPSSDGGVDHDARKDGGDDGPLARRVKLGPLGAQSPRRTDEAVERRGA